MKERNQADGPAAGRFLQRTWVQLLILLAIGSGLGLIFNSLNPDGIPLVKRGPGVEAR